MTTSPATPRAIPSGSSNGSPSAEGAVTPEMLRRFEASFEANPAHLVAQNAVTQAPVEDVVLDRRVLTSIDHTFSHVLDDWAVTNQKKSGRCWMFAALNLFRAAAIRRMNLKSFEFSQNHPLFWDKFERSNYFLEAIIETREKDLDDRTVAFLLDRPTEDGGQWNMFLNIVRKHGVVPKSAMPETQSSSDTKAMNTILLAKLREGARTLRAAHEDGASLDELREKKAEILEGIHRILSIHLGTPPETFDWQWNDEEKHFHRDGAMTPREFAAKYIEIPLEEYVCLVHDPRPTSPRGKVFTVQYLGNVVGGEIVTYLNVDIDTMKNLAARAIVENEEPVWFGCDVGKMMRRDLGVWDEKLFAYDRLYDTSFDLTKAERLRYHDTQMTHAMLFTGVDLLDGSPRRWRVENSWGEENGRKGFFTMNDSWFDEHVFEIAARKSHLPEALKAALKEEPIVLPPWDPMGALARG